ncbi:MAG: putative lysozyme [Rhodocyclaceae bacterium]|nr:putative lysozyme [Rhodocyclaceae bacterium]
MEEEIRGAAFTIAAPFLRRVEGVRMVPYCCEAGRLTNGCGHVLLPGDPAGAVTMGQVEAWLWQDMSRAADEIDVPGLSANEAAALLSFVFNVGAGAWKKSTLRRMLLNGDKRGAADQFRLWCHVGGRRSEGLAKRRANERAIFLGEI